ncbi:MAG: cytochrome C oxidase subunit IV family protein [Gammaproteobacteria bacterium]|nr:cytochrome C oxidase subunit IV family protein [Gammaproteobacteria bacterium]
MLEKRSIDIIWLILMGLTLLSAALAESAEPGLVVTIIIALTVAFKGRMVVDRFMELANASRYLRNAMRIYLYVIPTMILLVYLFPETLARMTSLN